MKDYSYLVGQKFGRLVVEALTGAVFMHKGRPMYPYIVCLCDCGKSKTTIASNVFRGLTQSCGCLHKERTSAARITHGHTTVDERGRQVMSKEYKAWSHAIQRCENPKTERYKDYGGRGISICREWRESFQAFYDHIGPAPSPEHSLDRIRVNENYEPGNVRWATAKVQANNKRPRPRLVWRGRGAVKLISKV